jgi:hypothetical protein
MKKNISKKSAPAAAKAQPADSEQIQARIRHRAYELWEQSGYVHGRDFEHWLQAKVEILGPDSDQEVPE